VTSDASLILRARGGDESAWCELTKRFENFIRFVALTYFIPGGETDDLEQEGLIGLFKAVRDYRGGRGAEFRTFAKVCIYRQILTAVSTARRAKHRVLNDAAPLDSTLDDEEGITLGEAVPAPLPDFVESIEVERELAEVADRIRERLSATEFEALIRHVEGLSYEDIAAEVGIDRKSVDNCLQRAWRKLAAERQPHEGRYRCPRCQRSTRKRQRRGRPPVCIVCRAKPRAAARAAAA
jgi:RNA polymerase sporulation-specific sigma factor